MAKQKKKSNKIWARKHIKTKQRSCKLNHLQCLFKKKDRQIK